MRHLFPLPVLCVLLAACATPSSPQPGGPFTLARGAGMPVASGLVLRFDAVDDSRCPAGVQCVWAGRLSYRFSLRRGAGMSEAFSLSPEQPAAAPAALQGLRIVLDTHAIPPAPAPGATVDYRATFSIVPSQP